MAVSFTVFEIKRDIGRKTSTFSYHFVFKLHDHLEPLKVFPKILIQTVRVPGVVQRYVQVSAYCATTSQTDDDRRTAHVHSRT